MDPNAALKQLIDSLTSGDVDAAREIFDDLAGWLDSGGFAPSPL